MNNKNTEEQVVLTVQNLLANPVPKNVKIVIEDQDNANIWYEISSYPDEVCVLARKNTDELNDIVDAVGIWKNTPEAEIKRKVMKLAIEAIIYKEVA